MEKCVVSNLPMNRSGNMKMIWVDRELRKQSISLFDSYVGVIFNHLVRWQKEKMVVGAHCEIAFGAYGYKKLLHIFKSSFFVPLKVTRFLYCHNSCDIVQREKIVINSKNQLVDL